MLWIGNQITALNIIKTTILPSLVCFVIPAFIISRQVKGSFEKIIPDKKVTTPRSQRNAVFFVGTGMLLFVPVFKTITHLPHFMGILFGLGIMWIVTEMIHSGKDESERGVLSVNHALRKIDTPSILFFLGILISIGALQATGILVNVAGWLEYQRHYDCNRISFSYC
jgi:Na+/H+ antiporter NhaD/arsenite permease-like protein